MRRAIRISLILLVVAALGGCLGGRPIRYYTLEAPLTLGPPSSAYPVTLIVGHIGAPEILKDQPIIYRSGRNEIGLYQYHQWIEPPAQMVKIMLIRRLRASGKFQSVADLGSSVQGEFVLQGRLYDFEEVDTGSIAALVSMEFELIDRKAGKTVWKHSYSHSEPVQGKKVSDVVSALDHNLTQGMNEVVDSLQTYFSANLAQKP
jgi:ABC-type uncharacterized transport system auxiliary subunit